MKYASFMHGTMSARRRPAKARWPGAIQAFAVMAIASLCVIASWGTYYSFAPYLTLGTITSGLVIVAAIPAVISFFVGYRTYRLELFDFLPLALVGIVALSAAWALAPAAWAQQVFYWTLCSLLYLGVRINTKHPATIPFLVLAMAIGGLIGVFSVQPPEEQFYVPEARAQVDGLNANFTAYVLAATCYFLLIYARAFSTRTLYTLAAWAIVAVLTIGILRLDTRGALLAVALMLAWDAYSRIFSARIALPIAIIGLAIGAAFTFGAFEWIAPLIEGQFERNTGDLSGRQPVWEYARQMIADSPLLGIGAGSFPVENLMGIGAHNIILTILLDTGVIGLAVFAAFLVCGFWPAIRPTADWRQRYILGGFTVYFVCIALSGHIELSPFTWLLLGLTFTILRYRVAAPAKPATTLWDMRDIGPHRARLACACGEVATLSVDQLPGNTPVRSLLEIFRCSKCHHPPRAVEIVPDEAVTAQP